MYDMYYYDQQQNPYGQDYGMEEDEEGFDSEDGMNGLYDGLADRIWDEND